jgi:autotransporter-associated beta strand protein
MKRSLFAVIGSTLLLTFANSADAGSAEWNLNPTSDDWNTAANWTPATVPNGSSDIAIFALSNTTNVSISADVEVNGIAFRSAATNPYAIAANPGLTLTISGTGIANSSGVTQNFVSAVDGAGNSGRIAFTNSATAGNSTVFTNNGSVANFAGGGQTAFFDTSTAQNGTFINKGPTGDRSGGGTTVFHDFSTAGDANFINDRGEGVSTSATIFLDNSTAANGTFVNSGGGGTGGVFGEGGQTLFFNNSTAGNGNFVNNGATVSGRFGGATVFDDNSTAGNGIFTNNGGAASGVAALGGAATFFFGTASAGHATFTNNAAPVSGAEGGVTQFGLSFFNFSPSAGNGTFINNGADVNGAVGGKTVFYNTSTAGAATLIAKGGINGGGGGGIFFEQQSTGGTARVEVFGNGFLDISGHLVPHPPLRRSSRVTVGSIEGDGDVFLGRNNLIVGSNNLSTTFSGVIRDGGANFGFAGSLTKIGTGTLDLTGAETYTGNTNVDGGVLKVDGSITSNVQVHERGALAGTGTINGSVVNKGKVTPGDAPGVLTIGGNYTQGTHAHLLVDIAGSNASQVSLLDVLGTANLNGFLNPVLEDSFVPTIGESFTFLNCASLTGAFSRIKDPNIRDGVGHWEVAYAATNAILTVAPGKIVLPDQGSTFLLLTFGLSGVVTYRRQFAGKRLL